MFGTDIVPDTQRRGQAVAAAAGSPQRSVQLKLLNWSCDELSPVALESCCRLPGRTEQVHCNRDLARLRDGLPRLASAVFVWCGPGHAGRAYRTGQGAADTAWAGHACADRRALRMDGRGTGPTLPPIGHPRSPGTPGRSSRRASSAVKGPGSTSPWRDGAHSPGHASHAPAPELPPIGSAVRPAPRGHYAALPSPRCEIQGGDAALSGPGRGVHSATGSVQQMLSEVARTAKQPIEQKFNRCAAAPRSGPPDSSYLTVCVRACAGMQAWAAHRGFC